MTGEVKGKYVKGKYRGKAINALVKNGVITRFEYQDDKGKWFYPLIVDGQNVEKDKFELEVEQMSKIELDVLLTLEASQMSIEDFEDKDPGLSYNVNKDGTVDVHENQMSIDEVAVDEDDLLN